jgi:hypothetical protein
MTIRDQQFIEALFRECGRPAPRKELRIDLTRYGGRAGYRIDICDGARLVVSLAWCPMIRRRTHVLRGVNAQRVDMTAVDALVVSFLEKHRYGLTLKECDEITMLAMGALGEAIAHSNWGVARRMWAFLAPLHSMLIEHDRHGIKAVVVERVAIVLDQLPCHAPGPSDVQSKARKREPPGLRSVAETAVSLELRASWTPSHRAIVAGDTCAAATTETRGGLASLRSVVARAGFVVKELDFLRHIGRICRAGGTAEASGSAESWSFCVPGGWQVESSSMSVRICRHCVCCCSRTCNGSPEVTIRQLGE